MRRMTRFGSALAAAALSLLIGGAVSAADAPAASDIPSSFQLVADNPQLQLFLDQKRTQFIVRDRQTGRIWRTNPDLDDPNHPQPPNQLWHDHEQSQMIFEYTDAERRHEKTSDDRHETSKVSYQPIDGGVRVDFDIESLGITVEMDYVLGPDYLEVRIPDSGITETGKYLLTKIEPLPFFDAGLDSEQGYLIIPDGVGAIARFAAVHPHYQAPFEKDVYGDPMPTPYNGILDAIKRHTSAIQIGLPAFGIVHGDQGFLGVMTEGAFDSEIQASPAGYVLDHTYRTAVDFDYRRKFQLAFSRFNRPEAWTKDRIHEDRAVRYYLFQGDEANYAAMADRLGRYLRQVYQIQGHFNPDETTAPMLIQIFNAVTELGAVTNKLIPMTTFPQTQEILQKLWDEGVKDMTVVLSGWMTGGWDFGGTTKQWPPDNALGGAVELKKLTTWAHQHGIKIYLMTSFDHFWDGLGNHFDKVNDVVRDPAHLPIQQRGQYFTNPIVAYGKYAKPNVPNWKSVGADGIAFQDGGTVVYSDYNKAYPVNREQWGNAYEAILKLSQKELGGAAVGGGNSYMLGGADFVFDAPLEPSEKTFVDEEIPFWPIVVHGLLPYYGRSVNLWSDPQRDLLRNIEFGALPRYVLSYNNSSLLIRTWASEFYSTQVDTWIDDIVEKYNAINVKMGYLAPQPIVGHDQVQDNVFVTKYADGSKTYVNYNPDPVTVDGVKVGGLNYVLIPGGK